MKDSVYSSYGANGRIAEVYRNGEAEAQVKNTVTNCMFFLLSSVLSVRIHEEEQRSSCLVPSDIYRDRKLSK
jgi:hypothetical protein